MQPDNAIIGDESGIDLPQAPENIVDLTEEKKMAKYSRSAEFKRLKEYMETRIGYFQKYLPDGEAVSAQKPQDMVNHWIVANLVIGEFQLILDEYERINGVVDESQRA